MISLFFSMSHKWLGDMLCTLGMYILLPKTDICLIKIVCGHYCHIHSLNAGWCLFKYLNQYLSRKAPNIVPAHCGSMISVTCFHDCPNWGLMICRTWCSSFPGGTPRGPDVGQGDSIFDPTSNCGIKDCHYWTHFLVTKRLLLCSTLSFVLAMHSLISLTEQRHSSHDNLSYFWPIWMVRPAILCLKHWLEGNQVISCLQNPWCYFQ